MTFESFMAKNGAPVKETGPAPTSVNVAPVEAAKELEPIVDEEVPDVPTQVVNENTVVQPSVIPTQQSAQPVVINTTIKKPIQTQVQVNTGVNNIHVDTQSKVVPQNDQDDDFMDDFFE